VRLHDLLYPCADPFFENAWPRVSFLRELDLLPVDVAVVVDFPFADGEMLNVDLFELFLVLI
jgi:hypothetical protein